MTTHPAAPVAPRARPEVLAVSRGGAAKGSRSRRVFPHPIPAKFAVFGSFPRGFRPELAACGTGYTLKSQATERGPHGQM